jgi:hypothetical protein
MIEYRHTQVARPMIVLIGVFAAVMIAILAREGFPPVPTLAFAAAVLLLANFASLTVTVDRERVACRFGLGPFGRKIALADVRGVREARNAWWYGWGIRITPHGWLYNVWGLGAIELELAPRGRVRIGSDEPDRLARAVRDALAARTVAAS